MSVGKVLVVGAGIGGLGAALALGRRKVEVDVVDIKPVGSVLGVGINQPGNSLRALDALGVLEKTLASGFSYSRNEFRDWRGDLIVSVPSALGDHRVPANNALSRASLHDILRSAVEETGAVIRYGTTVTDLVDDGRGVDVTLSDGSTGRYDAVAAFDGLRSDMRSRLFGPDSGPDFTGFAIWRVQVPRPEQVRCCVVYQGHQRKAGVIPLSSEEMYMFVVTPEPGNPRYEQADFARLLAGHLEGFTGVIGAVRDNLTADSRIVYSPLYEVMKPLPWHSGRTITLGDAVHAAAPHLTQGAGMALEDAVVLADRLLTDAPVESALASVGRIRHDRARLVFDASHAILESEMQVTRDNLPASARRMRAELPAQFAFLESRLNLPFRDPGSLAPA